MQRLNIVKVEDILLRKDRFKETEQVKAMVDNKVIMITGAGGSIGSEITRQLMKFSPSLLILVDNGEYNLYKIDYEVMNRDVKRVPVIADVRDKQCLNKIFTKYKPDIVIHAAALKHVPMVEFNIEPAIHTNIVGTSNVADLAIEHNVEIMVMVSTDKAVNPTNVMGATKRAAEKYCQHSDLNAHKTKFATVRFGNVLGSNGSVFELFNNQIREGKNLTLTDKKMERFFMTIPEASFLVLNAASMTLFNNFERGSIFVLKMGEAVKIIDMAEKMIKLSGLKLHEDIEIVETGLRPGEKLYEEIFYNTENIINTDNPDIMIANTNKESLREIRNNLQKMRNLIKDGSGSDNDFLEIMKETVSSFNHNNNLKERY